MTEIPTEKMAVLSTAHLPELEAHQLTVEFDRNSITGMMREEGYLLYIKPLESAGPYEFNQLNFIMGSLKAQGFVWVLFDRDADTVEHFTTFEW